MEFNWQDFDKDYSDLDPRLMRRVEDWFVGRFGVDFRLQENPLAGIMCDSAPLVLNEIQNQRRAVLIRAAIECLDIFPEGLCFHMDNDLIYPFFQISAPAIDPITGLAISRQASLGLLISPSGLPFAIKIGTVMEASSSSGERSRTSVEIIDMYSERNRAEIAFYDLNDIFGLDTTSQGFDDRLGTFCTYSAFKLRELELLNAYEHITMEGNGVLDSFLKWLGRIINQ